MSIINPSFTYSDEKQLITTEKVLFTSHPNTINKDLVLKANRNYYSSGMVIIEDDITVTLPINSAWFIGD